MLTTAKRIAIMHGASVQRDANSGYHYIVANTKPTVAQGLILRQGNFFASSPLFSMFLVRHEEQRLGMGHDLSETTSTPKRYDVPGTSNHLAPIMLVIFRLTQIIHTKSPYHLPHPIARQGRVGSFYSDERRVAAQCAKTQRTITQCLPLIQRLTEPRMIPV
jgi:hypothetical protein